MTANETNILDFLEGAKKVFIIPPFQRNYEWNTIQCEELFEDIKLIASDEGKKHYLGNIVFILFFSFLSKIIVSYYYNIFF